MRPLPIALALMLLAPAARAGVSEIRLGVLGHDVGVFGSAKEEGPDLNGEVLFDPLRILWAPRPHLGVSLNTRGDTSQAYAGLTWSWNLTRDVFVEASLGGALHNGYDDTDRPDRKSLGFPLLFRESLGLGVRVGPNLTLSLFLDHVSNARLADRNQGLDNFGIRWGYRF